MHVDLKTTISAYLAAAPIVLDNYYTKDEVYSKKEIDLRLEDFVREVQDGDPATIYGRQNGKWVPIIRTPQNSDGMLVYGFSSQEFLNEASLLNLPGRQILLKDTNEYLVESRPDANGYLWFCCTKKIIDVQADSGLAYKQEVTRQPSMVTLIIDGVPYDFYCYKTRKLAAIPGVVFKYVITID